MGGLILRDQISKYAVLFILLDYAFIVLLSLCLAVVFFRVDEQQTKLRTFTSLMLSVMQTSLTRPVFIIQATILRVQTSDFISPATRTFLVLLFMILYMAVVTLASEVLTLWTPQKRTPWA